MSSLTLAVSAAVLFFTALTVNRISQAPALIIDKADWTWMANVSLGLAPGANAYGPLVQDAPENLPQISSPILKEVSRPIVHHFAFHQTASVWKAHSQAAVILAAAKPTLLQKRRKITVAVPQIQKPEVQAELSEMQMLRRMHEELHEHFQLSMNLNADQAQDLLAKMTTQPEPEPMIVALTAQQPKRKHTAPKSAKKKWDQINVVQAAPQAQPDRVPGVEKNEKPAAVAKPAQPVVILKPIQAPVKLAVLQFDYSKISQQKQISSPMSSVTVLDDTAPQALPAVQVGSEVIAPPAPVPAIAPESPPINPNSGVTKMDTQKEPPPVIQTSIITMSQSAPVRAAEPPKVVTTQSILPVTNQPTVGKPAVLAKTDTPRVTDYSLHEPATNHAQLAAPTVPAIKPVVATEAFDWVTAISNAVVTQVTHEVNGSDSHWVKAEAIDHITTLIRRSSHSEEAIPLISNNAGKLLSTLAGTTVQAEAGIVFGKVPSGWTVRLSGRSERPLFLNSQNLTVSSQQVQGDRYFAFLNVEPGAHLLYLVNRSGIEEGAVGVSSLSGVASYMNLSQISHMKVSGRVFDGSEAQIRTLPGAEVRVLGSVATHSQADNTGSFTIEHVLTVGDYPIYLETDAQNGFTHRYQMAPAEAAEVALYRLNEKAIQGWVNQLEGSISPESGLIVAAAPNLVSASGKQAKLLPSVRSLAANPTLRPEVYTLAGDGALQVSTPLDLDSSRFISVQIPEGPTEVSLSDAKGNLTWSDLIMASPAVINMIGPL